MIYIIEENQRKEGEDGSNKSKGEETVCKKTGKSS